jgi:FHS family L-fucose permease-like MFS transporter
VIRNRGHTVLYILFVWFVISFVTNIIGPLMPIIIRDFRLSLALAGVLPFSFFMAYGVVSIPAGIMVERIGPKSTLLAAFLLNVVGALWFAVFPTYLVVVAALFVIGAGMAMLQVVINPLMRTAGGEAHFAFYSVLAQLVFGLASFLSPLVFSALMQSSPGALAWLGPDALPWISFYWGFAAIFVLLIVGTAALHIPRLDLKEDERAGTAAVYGELLRDRHVRLFFLGIVAYVGTEQSLANWMSQFLSTYHGVSPTLGGAHAVGAFWGLMSLGCVFGLLLLKLLDSKFVLGMFCTGAIVCVALALFGAREIALFAFPMAGFFLSVMFSVVFSLALNSTRRHHGALSGILCTGILGGALLPLLVGMLGDWLGLRAAMSTVFLSLVYLLGIGIWADPIIRNDTVSIAKLLGWSKLSRAGERPT